MKQMFIILLLSGCVLSAGAQDVYTSSGKSNYKKTKKKQGYDPDRLIIGGGVNAGFGGGYMNLGIAPIVGYRITNALSAGIGVGYQFYKAPEYVDPVDPYKVSYAYQNTFYPSVWSRLFVFRNFYISGTFEYDFINYKGGGYDNFGNLTTIKKHVTNACALVGVGLRQPLGGRVSAYFELLYDVLQGQYSPYPKGAPDIRVGFAAGL